MVGREREERENQCKIEEGGRETREGRKERRKGEKRA